MGAKYKRPNIATVELETAGTQYEYQYPEDATKMHISSRLGGELKLAFVDGSIGDGVYKTIPAGSTGFWLDMFLSDSKTTMFVTSSESNDVLEVLFYQ